MIGTTATDRLLGNLLDDGVRTYEYDADGLGRPAPTGWCNASLRRA
jgi:hypothetical protein